MTVPVALAHRQLDSSGGAGVQADLKRSALGVYGASVITALTAQNTTGVSGIHQVPAEFVTAQIDAVFSDLAGGCSQDRYGGPACEHRRHRSRAEALVADVVLDDGRNLGRPPAGGGGNWNAQKTRSVRVDRRTPNLPEAAALLDEPVAESEAAVEHQGKRLLAMGCRAVLIKGGREGNEGVDYLDANGTLALAAPSPPGIPTAPAVRCHRPLLRVSRKVSLGDRRAQRQNLDQRRDLGRRPLRASAMATAGPSFS